MKDLEKRLKRLADTLESAQLPSASVTVGFDAVIDVLVRPVRSVDHAGNRAYFSGIGQFGAYLQEKDGRSCVIELSTVMEKPGGNMVNLAATLGRLGARTNCVGTLGLPEPEPLIREFLGENCTLHPVGPSGKCTALEFNTGKIMLSQMGEAAELTYGQILSHLGPEKMDSLFGRTRILGLLNWSEIYNSTDIWRSIFENHIRPLGPDFEKDVLIDITDCSRSAPEQLVELFGLIRELGTCRRVTLSLNRNEAELLGRYLNLSYETENWKQLAGKINRCAGSYCTVIHLLAGSVAVCGGEAFLCQGFRVEVPVISTGGGDNYNAGLAFAMLLGFDVGDAMVLANAASNYYVSHGIGPTRKELADHLRMLAYTLNPKGDKSCE